jgi:hypothetical protein
LARAPRSYDARRVDHKISCGQYTPSKGRPGAFCTATEREWAQLCMRGARNHLYRVFRRVMTFSARVEAYIGHTINVLVCGERSGVRSIALTDSMYLAGIPKFRTPAVAWGPWASMELLIVLRVSERLRGRYAPVRSLKNVENNPMEAALGRSTSSIRTGSSVGSSFIHAKGRLQPPPSTRSLHGGIPKDLRPTCRPVLSRGLRNEPVILPSRCARVTNAKHVLIPSRRIVLLKQLTAMREGVGSACQAMTYRAGHRLQLPR